MFIDYTPFKGNFFKNNNNNNQANHPSNLSSWFTFFSSVKIFKSVEIQPAPV